MADIVRTFYSTTPGNVPPSLDIGQFAVNLVDKRIFVANATQIFDAFQNTILDIAITNSSGAAYRVGNATVNLVINSTSYKFQNSTVSFTFPLPTASDISGGKLLCANGSWATGGGGGGGTPGGSNTNIQINDSGSLFGSNAFSFDKSTNTVNLDGNFTANADYISLGNNTVNTIANSTGLVTGNSSVKGSLNATACFFGTSSIGGASQTNGYSVMPNGLIFQWGYAAAGAAGVNAVFTTPFPTACFSVVAIPTVSTANVWINALSTAQTYIRTTVACNVYYMAIGR